MVQTCLRLVNVLKHCLCFLKCELSMQYSIVSSVLIQTNNLILFSEYLDTAGVWCLCLSEQFQNISSTGLIQREDINNGRRVPNIFTQRASVSVWHLLSPTTPLICSLKDWREYHIGTFLVQNGRQPHLSHISFVSWPWLEIFLGLTKQNFVIMGVWQTKDI